MLRNNFEVSVIVNGGEIREYEHEGMTFVEGKPGTDFSIKLRNNTWQKVLAVLTVDGKSVINGEAGNVQTSPGYILMPHSTMVVPGWRINDSNVAKFIFVNKEESYVASSGSGTANVGIIGCAFFNEKPNYCFGHHWIQDNAKLNDWVSPPFARPTIYFTTQGNLDVKDVNLCYNTENASINGNGIRSVADSATYTTNCCAQGQTTDNHIGTGFGKKQYHSVATEQFTRSNDVQTVIEIFYDTREGLKEKGIQLTPKARISASAFSGLLFVCSHLRILSSNPLLTLSMCPIKFSFHTKGQPLRIFPSQLA